MGVFKMVKRAMSKNRDNVPVLNDQGDEMVSSKPMSASLKVQRRESIEEMLARLIRSEDHRRALQSADIETFDEADDFDVNDDMDLSSPYEEDFDHARIAAVDKGLVKAPDAKAAKEAKSRLKAYYEAKTAKKKTDDESGE